MNTNFPSPEAIDLAITEIRMINERKKSETKQKELRTVNCPDCNAILQIELSSYLPDDIKITFVKHQ